jgi:type 1 glutamine amidotransferase
MDRRVCILRPEHFNSRVTAMPYAMSRVGFGLRWVLGSLVLAALVVAPSTSWAQTPPANAIVYEGTSGPGRGKHIVFIAGDQEYRSEEALPMLARILARHYGFKSTVIFTIDPQTGFIDVNSSHMTGLEMLRTADLLVLGLRYRDFADDQMQHIADYLTRGGPIVGLRTSTHAFQIRRPDATFAAWTDTNKDPAFAGGFGRQILGETWVSHYGTNHVQYSRLLTVNGYDGMHPILTGVRQMFMQSGGYTADPMPDSNILVLGEILNGPTPTAERVATKKQMPVAWTRTYTYGGGKPGRVFTTTHGASEDLLNDGFRRMLVNAALWCTGLESSIRATGSIAFVGEYKPSPYAFNGSVREMKPSDMAGWITRIPTKDPPVLPARGGGRRGGGPLAPPQ